MAKLTEQDFRKELTKGEPARVYLIYGEEKYLVRSYTAMTVSKAAGKKPSDFDFIKLRSDAAIDELFDASEQLPVCSAYRCILVTDFNAEALSEAEMKLLEEYLSDIPETTVIIFSMPTVNYDAGKGTGEKKGTKYKKLTDAAAKNGIVLELAKKSDTALEKHVTAWAEKNGCTINRANAGRIVSMCGTDMTNLKNEVDKLSAYANGREITEDMIDLLATVHSEVRIYALSDCLARKDYNGAYKNLYKLFEQNEKPEIILSVLSSVFVDMYRARVASESGKSIAECAADFKYGRRDFVLKNALANSKSYSTGTLRRFLDAILDADIKLKSSRADSQILLETLIAKLILTAREEQN